MCLEEMTGMFNIGMFEIILVLLVAFLVVGPKDLPKVARWLGRQFKTIRKLIREIKQETGWNEFAKEFKDTESDIKSSFKEADISRELKDASDELEKSVNDVKHEVSQATENIKNEVTGGMKK